MKKNHTQTSSKTNKRSKRNPRANSREISAKVMAQMAEELQTLRFRLSEEKSRVASDRTAVLTKLTKERDQWRERADGYKAWRDDIKQISEQRINGVVEALDQMQAQRDDAVQLVKDLQQQLSDWKNPEIVAAQSARIRDLTSENVKLGRKLGELAVNHILPSKRPFAVSCQVSKTTKYADGGSQTAQSITQSVRLATSVEEAIGLAVQFTLKEKSGFGIEQVIVSDINFIVAAQQQSETDKK